MIKILILSLEDSPRREIIKKRLLDKGIENFEFVDAFDARNMDLSEISKIFDVKKFKKIYGRDPARGEIGCTLSHLKIWTLIKDNDLENYVILEDDAILMPWFKYGINNIVDFNFLTILGYSKFSWLRFILSYFKPTLINSRYKYAVKIGNKKVNSFCGTVSYSINKNDCMLLLSEFERMPFFLIDDWDLFSRVVNIKHVKPLFVLEDYKKLESTIGAERIHNERKI